LLNGKHIGWRFNNTDGVLVPGGALADATKRFFGKGPALLAMPHTFHCRLQGFSESFPAVPVLFKEMQNHTLGRLGPDAWKSSKGID
jgi:hypothetical protein